MRISKRTFIQSMKLIWAAQIKYERLYDKLENCVGCSDQIIEQANIEPMISMLEMICGDGNKLISLYIFDANWGNEPCCLEDQYGRRLPFRALEDLYNALKQPYSCRLELCYDDIQ